MMKLDVKHQTGLRNGLSIAERAVQRAEIMLALAWPPHAAAQPAAAARFRALADQFHAEVAALRGECELGHEPRDVRPLVFDELCRARDALEVSRPEELVGFGPLDPAVADALRPRIAGLLILLRGLERAVGALPAADV
jgi:hypothetical protein